MELAAVIALLEQYRYLILFPLACIEGPMLGFITGTLIPLGYFSPLPLFVTLVLADIIPDVAYYFLGRWGNNKAVVEKWGHKIRLTPERFELLRKLWHTHTVKAMMITKFSYGISTPLLITAGLVQVPFNRFWKWSAVLAAAQYSVLMALGYFFGGYFAMVESTIVRVQILVAAAVVVFIIYYVFTKSVRKNFAKELE
jgi:membrane protein DedA with SNARE-associated domain